MPGSSVPPEPGDAAGRPVLRAGTAYARPARWAVLQRRLFGELDQAWREFSARYCDPAGDGRLVFHDRLGVPPDDRDGVDDFYEPFFNWPLLYVLGGADDLLAAARRHWLGVTAQLTEAGMVAGGHDRGYDWFHQGEGLLLLYHLCLAAPEDERIRAQAIRSAELYLGGRPGNYDPGANVVTAPHNGADGPRPGLTGGAPVFPWSPVFAWYGLPLDWIEGIDSYDALVADPVLARRMGEEMRDRMGRGDTAVNLAATSLMANAFLLTGREEFRVWVLRYAGGWLERARANGGVLPDNAGLDGRTGAYLDGRWYGGHYGWAWPHGLHSVGAAAVIAACNAVLVGGGKEYLELGRSPLDAVLAGLRTGPDGVPTVPYKHNDSGWHGHRPLQAALPAALWHVSQDPADAERLERATGPDRNHVAAVRTKEEAGHEVPWLSFLAGTNPDYPERALQVTLDLVRERRRAIAADPTDPATGPSTADIHHWQDRNPVLTEVLGQLTCGAPQPLYNGGLWHARLRYHDAERGRPGLPPDVAALVTAIAPDRTAVTLVNLDPAAARRVLVRAGSFGQHTFGTVRQDGRPGLLVHGPEFEVVLGGGCSTEVVTTVELHDRRPAHH
ncbi:hypothetical protein [Actinacidiphila guanduensis]|uniref:hypothetical protein n=1 Tax=Actinacidiphila guanduensis TaxID=310781 RepID=UPI00115F8208|nr:hypothetical protein [Actinacidiphila guanduensis]